MEESTKEHFYTYAKAGIFPTLDEMRQRISDIYGINRLYQVRRPLYALAAISYLPGGIGKFQQVRPTQVYRNYYSCDIDANTRLYLEEFANGTSVFLVSTRNFAEAENAMTAKVRAAIKLNFGYNGVLSVMQKFFGQNVDIEPFREDLELFLGEEEGFSTHISEVVAENFDGADFGIGNFLGNSTLFLSEGDYEQILKDFLKGKMDAKTRSALIGLVMDELNRYKNTVNGMISQFDDQLTSFRELIEI